MVENGVPLTSRIVSPGRSPTRSATLPSSTLEMYTPTPAKKTNYNILLTGNKGFPICRPCVILQNNSQSLSHVMRKYATDISKLSCRDVNQELRCRVRWLFTTAKPMTVIHMEPSSDVCQLGLSSNLIGHANKLIC